MKTDELEIINRVRDIVEGMSPIPCTQCDYCMPCPNGVNIPLNFGVYNRIVMYEDLKRCKFEYDRRVMDDEKAEQCIQCDECLPKCPQNIPISSWMPVIADVLGNNQPFVASV